MLLRREAAYGRRMSDERQTEPDQTTTPTEEGAVGKPSQAEGGDLGDQQHPDGAEGKPSQAEG